MKEELDPNKKNLADVLLSLQAHAFNSAANRQQYEWKLSLSLWTTFAVLLGILLKGGIHDIPLVAKVGVTVVAFAMFLLHLVWVLGAGVRTGADLNVTYFWEKKIMSQMLETEYPQEIKEKHEKLLKASGKIYTYSLLSQVSITFLLAVAVILVTVFHVGSKRVVDASETTRRQVATDGAIKTDKQMHQLIRNHVGHKKATWGNKKHKRKRCGR